MATNEMLASNVVFQYRASGSTAIWKTLVCETALNGELSNTVNEVSTKCGIIKTVGVPGATISGSGVANTSPNSDQGSLAELLDLANAATLMEGRMINLATTSPSVSLGAAVLLKGSGYFTSVAPAADVDQALTFDWTFTISGTVDTTEAGES